MKKRNKVRAECVYPVLIRYPPWMDTPWPLQGYSGVGAGFNFIQIERALEEEMEREA